MSKQASMARKLVFFMAILFAASIPSCRKDPTKPAISAVLNPILFLNEKKAFQIEIHDTSAPNSPAVDTLLIKPIKTGPNTWAFSRTRLSGSITDTISYYSVGPLLVLDSSVFGMFEAAPLMNYGYKQESLKLLNPDSLITLNGQNILCYAMEKRKGQINYLHIADVKYQNPFLLIFRVFENEKRLYSRILNIY